MSCTPIDDKVKELDEKIEAVTDKVTEQVKRDIAAIKDTVGALYQEREESINRRFIYFCLLVNLGCVAYIFLIFPAIKGGFDFVSNGIDYLYSTPLGWFLPKEKELRAKLKPQTETITPPSSSEYQFPVSGKVIFSSPFLPCTTATNCRDGKPHRGIDLAGSMGQPILAIADGTIRIEHTGCDQSGGLHSFCGGGYGNWVSHNLTNGKTAVYAHLAKIHVANGQKVKKGQVIGEMGNSGRSTGVHLHLELRQNGEYLDPAKYFELPPLWGGTGVSVP